MRCAPRSRRDHCVPVAESTLARSGLVGSVVLTLDLNGVHTPSDIPGGLVLAGVVMFAVLSLSPDAPYQASSLGRADHPSEHPDGRPRQQLPPRRAPSYEER